MFGTSDCTFSPVTMVGLGVRTYCSFAVRSMNYACVGVSGGEKYVAVVICLFGSDLDGTGLYCGQFLGVLDAINDVFASLRYVCQVLLS